MTTPLSGEARRGIRTAQLGILVNAVLAMIKLVAGLVGNAYALVADAVESTADIFASSIVWGGLRLSAREPDAEYPFGYGKAEPVAAAVVSLMLIGAAAGIAVEAVDEIRQPRDSPAAWTLVVLVGVALVKWLLARRVRRVGAAIGSTAVQADAGHHLGDAVTSLAAFCGISIAVVGGPGWERADGWAALFAALVIASNGVRFLRPALDEIMDRMPGPEVSAAVRAAAEGVRDVRAVEKLGVRKTGTSYRVTIHVQADASMSLDDAHRLGGRVKSAIRERVPRVQSVLVHMEPFHG
jgi:cation diffusion facilitator family transporter